MNTLIFADKNTSEILPFTVEFSDRLLLGETLVTPFLTVQVASGTDPTPSAMIQTGSPTLNSTNDGVVFTLIGGIPGVIYRIVVSAITSAENLYLKVGNLAIVASDPFASDAFSP